MKQLKQSLIFLLLYSISFMMAVRSLYSDEIFMSQQPRKYSVVVSWDKNLESDIKGYNVYAGLGHRDYNYVEFVTDTIRQISFSNSIKSDSVFIAITAIDSANNESKFSAEIGLIPEIIYIDLVADDKMRIDMDDYWKYYFDFDRFQNCRAWKLFHYPEE